VDPDLSSGIAALTAVMLAVLGARRRAKLPAGAHPTGGERVADHGSDLVRSAATVWGGLGHFAANVAAGAIEVGGIATAAAVRGASNVSTAFTTGVATIAGDAVARAGGLVVDGGLAVTDRFRPHTAR
jgi:hypothetical protein